jgi:hypothetical protein
MSIGKFSTKLSIYNLRKEVGHLDDHVRILLSKIFNARSTFTASDDQLK